MWLIFLGLALFIFIPINWMMHSRNPYITAHKKILKNDKNYEKYLEWLYRKGYGIPIDKVKQAAELKAENKIETLFK